MGILPLQNPKCPQLLTAARSFRAFSSWGSKTQPSPTLTLWAERPPSLSIRFRVQFLSPTLQELREIAWPRGWMLGLGLSSFEGSLANGQTCKPHIIQGAGPTGSTIQYEAAYLATCLFEMIAAKGAGPLFMASSPRHPSVSQEVT